MAKPLIRHRRWRLTALVALCLIASAERSNTSQRQYSRVAAQATAPEVLKQADGAAAALPRLRSIVASRGTEVIFERYYNAARQDRLANVKSVSKSVISALVGIAVDRGLIRDIKEPIVTYFPELARDPDARKR